MWWNAGVVRRLYVCRSRVMYQIDSGWVGFVGVWGGLCEYCVERRWGAEGRCRWGVVGQVSKWRIDYIEYEASAKISYLESRLGCVALGC
jgi:hypothetical protein